MIEMEKPISSSVEKMIYNKQSFHHPLVGQRLFNDKYGDFVIEKVFNQKYYISCCEFHYEKDNPHNGLFILKNLLR